MFITMKKSLTMAVFVVICLVVGCQTAETEDYHANSVIVGGHKDGEAAGSVAASLIQDYTLPPQSVQDLVNRSEAIVIGRVTAISEPVNELPYFTTEEDYADWPERMVPWTEVVYFDVAIEEVLLDDGNISDHPRIQLESNAPSPEINVRYLFTLGRNPDSLSYGISADWMILSLDRNDIRDLGGTAPGYAGVTDETSLVDGVRNAAAHHDFLPIGEWPLLSETGAGNSQGKPHAPGGPDDGDTGPTGNAGAGDS